MTGDAVPCDVDDCQHGGTHAVRIDFPGQPQELWNVCRCHDRQLKTSAVRSRTPAAPPADDTPAFLHCTDCGQPLQRDAPACPACGSGNRTITVSDTVAAHESVALKGRPSGAGKGKWFVSISAGDSYTRDLGAWINRELTMDKQHNRYRELLVLHDGTRIESVAQLTDHKECPD